LKLTWADKLLTAGLVVFSFLGIGASVYLFPGSGQQQAQISVDGKLIKTVTLRAGYREEFRIGGPDHYNIVEIDGEKIRVREADCPDQVCVKTGWVRVAPQQIVCLPWRVVIKVTSSRSADIDDIAR
jgi:hypothetical protein